MKIMVVMGEYPAEEGERRRQAVLKCASPGTEIGYNSDKDRESYSVTDSGIVVIPRQAPRQVVP